MFFDYMMTGFKSKPANDDEMIILNGKYSNKSIRFPYKPFYGLDRTLNCSQSIYSNFDHCEIQAQLEWDIRINGYFYSNQQFCCFIWTALDCETKVANVCNERFSKLIKDNTIEWFGKFCHQFNHSSWFCWWTPKNRVYVTIALIIITIITAICVTFCNRFPSNKKPPTFKIKGKNLAIKNENKSIIHKNIDKNITTTETKLPSKLSPTKLPWKTSVIKNEIEQQKYDYVSQYLGIDPDLDSIHSFPDIDTQFISSSTNLSELQGPSWRIFRTKTPPIMSGETTNIIAQNPIINNILQL
ncbi:uncharacterized protein LOC124493692 [Dermatophagoides farinae]|uniref:uncharacterized protein LOC124493692 n=1 Tax=Dermatophagoides farinae TaxID=6954 RepID=UPI003F5DBC01